MTKKTANIIAVLAMLGMVTGYYLIQYRKSAGTTFQPATATATADAISQPLAEKTAGTAGPIPSGDSLSLITGETASQTATPAEGELDRPEGMDWFYKRFGSSTWFAEGTFNVKSFTPQEYDALIAAALQGNESATIALKLSILKHLKDNPDDVEYKTLKDKVWAKDFLLSAPRFDILADTLPDEMMDDNEFVSKILKKNGRYLKFASERLRGDKKIVLEAVAQSVDSLEFASDKLKGDKEFAEKALEKETRGLCYLSEELRSDRKFVETYISRRSQAVHCLSAKLLDDKAVMEVALKNNPEYYRYASQRVQNDPDILPIIRKYQLSTGSPLYDRP